MPRVFFVMAAVVLLVCPLQAYAGVSIWLEDHETYQTSRVVDIGSVGPTRVSFGFDVVIDSSVAIGGFGGAVTVNPAGSGLFRTLYRLWHMYDYWVSFADDSMFWDRAISPQTPEIGGMDPRGIDLPASILNVETLLLEGTVTPGIYSFQLTNSTAGPLFWTDRAVGRQEFDSVGHFTLTVLPEPMSVLFWVGAALFFVNRRRSRFLR